MTCSTFKNVHDVSDACQAQEDSLFTKARHYVKVANANDSVVATTVNDTLQMEKCGVTRTCKCEHVDFEHVYIHMHMCAYIHSVHDSVMCFRMI